MDRHGYELIVNVLNEANIPGVFVTPEPEGRDNVDYLTIDTDIGVAPAMVLIALGQAGLMVKTPEQREAFQKRRPREVDTPISSRPQLVTMFGEYGSITLLDINGEGSR